MESISDRKLQKILLAKTAFKWREMNPEYQDGVVLIWKGSAYGWKNTLRNPESEYPGSIAVDIYGHVYIAEGISKHDSADRWELFC